jgi:SulP family sulfate permease
LKFPEIAYALRKSFREGYGLSELSRDLMSGFTVAFVAIPLGMALAIACGLPPIYGLYTVVVAGAFTALLGGSRFQVTGPTAAFVVILIPVVGQYGFQGLMLATLMAGVLLVLLSLSGLGSLIAWIPYPVIMGFTAGIALVIAGFQIKDFFGLGAEWSASYFLQEIQNFTAGGFSISWPDTSLGILTLVLIFVFSKFKRRLPPAVLSILIVTLLAQLGASFFEFFEPVTIGSRFGELPSQLPSFAWPWGERFDFEMVSNLMPSALTIAVLAAIESLLSASVADSVTGDRHDPNSELMALGVSNIFCSMFGGFAATGAIARTSANIEFGARSPLSAFFHAVFVLIALLTLMPFLSMIPLAALAALLMFVAYKMAELKNIFHFLKAAPGHDRSVFLACFGFTVFFDMVVGVTVGLCLAGLLFVKRVSETMQIKQSLPESSVEACDQTLVYKMSGPFFFGVAQKATSSLSELSRTYSKICFDLSDLQTMDYTALIAFENVIRRLKKENRQIEIITRSSAVAKLLKSSSLIQEATHLKVGS